MRKFLLILVCTAALFGCTNADIAQFQALNVPHTVTVYGWDGRVIKTYHSTGKVLAEHGSDGWYFEDQATRVLVRISGGAFVEVTPGIR